MGILETEERLEERGGRMANMALTAIYSGVSSSFAAAVSLEWVESFWAFKWIGGSKF